ncbi:Xaa-Pro aminopeptidase [Ferrimonas sediminicola]|uniref:Xaa-Pro aminopeptidase n=1 Tax=Ferrimonas sediminicola TaxID=2569538 RepID=A0A4U1BCG4_9GAMM|nr:Xaa-Pro aminopeptidase [Ferrimonas sediminicola]TKB48677.1 Xaa-Pro aminopeptidase [Ferrimonas sediminicola]
MEIKDFKAHRQQLMAALPEGSVAMLFAARECTRSNDTEYHFRQNSDFFYLTGFNEPDAVLLLRPGQTPESVIFVRPTDKLAEIWHGRRLGVEAAPEALQLDVAFSLDEMGELLPDLVNGADTLAWLPGQASYSDEAVSALMATLRAGFRQGRRAPTKQLDLRAQLHEMRLHKSDAEVALMARAGEISAKAHVRAMQACRPGLYEYQLEAEINHECAIHGARFMAYNSIVGGGVNACILHYTENEAQLNDGDLVLIDAGCELDGYAADITRTFPVNGRFSEEQRALYALVLEAEKTAISLLRPGISIKEANDRVLIILVSGLVALGILEGEVEALIEQEAYKAFYMHGLGHWIGIDVHDVGDYHTADRTRPLEPGMVLTIEPGLYIGPDAEVEARWRGIGIRVEDDVLITEEGHRVLTAGVPKEIDEIEALMAG